MNVVKSKKGRMLDIDTYEGSRAYLEDEGLDIEDLTANGLIDIWKLKQQLKEKIKNENNFYDKHRNSNQDQQGRD